MSVSLSEALGKVDLESGHTYRCIVNGLRVELRVLEPTPGGMPSLPVGSDVRIDPWIELPRPAIIICVEGRIGPPPAPDIPEMPGRIGLPEPYETS